MAKTGDKHGRGDEGFRPKEGGRGRKGEDVSATHKKTVART